jgi:uncharacterized membrane-anchored protein
VTFVRNSSLNLLNLHYAIHCIAVPSVIGVPPSSVMCELRLSTPKATFGIGYTGDSTLLFVCLALVLGLWYWSEGTISVNTVSTPKVEAFYWAAITFSQTLGTALGDWMADTGGLGYEGGAVVFAAGLA